MNDSFPPVWDVPDRQMSAQPNNSPMEPLNPLSQHVFIVKMIRAMVLYSLTLVIGYLFNNIINAVANLMPLDGFFEVCWFIGQLAVGLKASWIGYVMSCELLHEQANEADERYNRLLAIALIGGGLGFILATIYSLSSLVGGHYMLLTIFVSLLALLGATRLSLNLVQVLGAHYLTAALSLMVSLVLIPLAIDLGALPEDGNYRGSLLGSIVLIWCGIVINIAMKSQLQRTALNAEAAAAETFLRPLSLISIFVAWLRHVYSLLTLWTYGR